MKTPLVVASTNRGKLDELRALLEDLPVSIVSVADTCPSLGEIEEDGDTFEENALKKARIVANATMMLTLADDSGLEVEALGGRPGVRSARFAHERATDAQNKAALLEALRSQNLESSNPCARFRCVLVLIDPYAPRAEPILVEGCCQGTITSIARGSGGFGYDPLFVVDSMGKTMAELSNDEKNRLSHRAVAVQALRPLLERVLQSREAEIERISSAVS